MRRPYVLTFGWAAEPLSDQLAALGLQCDADMVVHFERDAEAIGRLQSRGVIPRGEGNRAYDRLAKKISRAVRSTATPAPASPAMNSSSHGSDDHLSASPNGSGSRRGVAPPRPDCRTCDGTGETAHGQRCVCTYNKDRAR